MIPVLFCDSDSVYKNFPECDVYDLSRDAFTYYGNYPLICHPPCRLFSRLRAFSRADKKEKQCAFFALEKVRRYGGILEHPRSSTLWKNGGFNLDGSVDRYGGFLRSVNLSWFGFQCEKKTMLYFCGLSPKDLPPFPMSLIPPEKKISELGQNKRSATPEKMIKYFIDVIKIIKK
ncbi:hypothetical protein AAH994_06045 [Weeksellaceae bacterium A-14]